MEKMNSLKPFVDKGLAGFKSVTLFIMASMQLVISLTNLKRKMKNVTDYNEFF